MTKEERFVIMLSMAKYFLPSFCMIFCGGCDMNIWHALLVLTVAASIAIASFWLPKLFLKTRYTLDKPSDRGIKKILEKNGQSMVFEPAVKWRKYISQYVLAERRGKKELLCKVNETLTYLSYDIVLFNNRDEVFKVLTVKDLLKNKGYAKKVELPPETSYVCVNVNQADTEKFAPPVTAKIAGGKIAKFLLCCSLCIVMEVLCVMVCCANAFGGVFSEIFVFDGMTALLTTLITVVLVLLNVIVSAIAVNVRGKKKIRVD